MNRALSLLIITLLARSYGFAQVNITNNGVVITNLSESIYIDGSLTNQTIGNINNAGSITIEGDIINNSSTALFDSASGIVNLTGKNQKITGTTSTDFHTLNLICQDTLILQQSIRVLDSIRFNTGIVNLNGNKISLSTSGGLSNENNSSHIFGLSGKVVAKKTFNSPSLANNIAGLGLSISSSHNFGWATIERGHSRQAAADSSIFRHYTIYCQNPGMLDSVSLSYFIDEITGNETDYKIFYKNLIGNGGWTNKDGAADFVNKNVRTGINVILDSAQFTIADQNCKTLPTIQVTGISNLVSLMSVDTLTCTKDTLSVNAYSTNANSLIQWKDMSDSIFANPLITTTPVFYKIEITDGITGCENSMLVNVSQNITTPQLDPQPDSLFLNCSYPSTQLMASSNATLSSLMWSGPSLNTSNPATTSKQGLFIVTATKADNGCKSADSVYVGYKPEIILLSSSDTTICKSSFAILSTSAAGNINGLTYLWSNGSIGTTTSLQAATTNTLIVHASAPGCNGVDTIVVTVPPELIDSVATYRPCDGSTKGTILLYAQGGIPPYLYSINNGTTFDTSGTFLNIPFGTYPVVIKDSIGCTATNTSTLNASSLLPIAQFIASTKNTKGDTIVLVDISTPQPDSIKWVLPSQAIVVGGDMFNLMIIMPDTGAFPIKMTGYFGDCEMDTTKIIYFHTTDTTIATAYNNNGIKNILLYPNPSSGSFSIEVEFYKNQNASIQIWDSSPTIHYQQNFSEVDKITLPLNLSQLQNGNYILRVIGEYNTKHLYFILSR